MRPNDKNAEHGILSGMMIDEESAARGIELVNADLFYTHSNRLLFIAMMEMFEANVKIDILTLGDKLTESKTLKTIGGLGFLNDLSDVVLSSSNMEHYANILIKKWLAREILKISKKTISKIENNDPVDTVLNNTREQLMNIDNSKETHNFSSIQAVTQTMKQTENIIVTGKPVGLKTYIHDLDNYILMKKGNLIAIVADGGTGKTMLANQIAFSNIMNGKKVCFFNMEMEYNEIINREISRQSRINSKEINHGKIQNIGKYNEYGTILADCIFHIDDNGEQTLTKIHSRLIKYRNVMKGLDLVVIDYFQLIEGGIGDSRQQQLGTISRGLKKISKYFQVPVIILAQSNEDGKIRESKDLQKDADIVLMLFRPAYDGHGIHVKDGVEKIKRDGRWIVPEEHFALIRITKHRGGDVATIRLAFDGSHQQFNGWEDGEYYE